MKPQALNILVVEDNPVDVLWIRSQLSEVAGTPFDMAHAENLADAMSVLSTAHFDVILLDLGLADSQGLATFHAIQDAAGFTPIVVTSGTQDERLAIEAVAAGAQDYLVKDRWDSFHLARAISYAIERQRLHVKLKETEHSLRRASRALRALTDCNHSIIHAKDEKGFLKDVCHFIVSVGGYRMAWVGFALDDKARTVQPVVWAGHEEGYLRTVRMTWADDEWGRGPTGVAIRTGIPKVNRNSRTEREYTPWRDEALKREYASSIALPLTGQNRVFGVLAIHAADQDAFDDEEVGLLTQLADDVSYGISMIRMRVAKESADKALRESEERFRAIFEGASDYIFIKDLSFRFTQVNPAAEKLFGLPSSKIIGLTHADLFGRKRAEYWRDLDMRVLKGESIEGETNPIINGMPMTFLESRAPLREESGNVIGILSILRNITERKRTELSPAASHLAFPSMAMRSTLKLAKMAAQTDSTLLLLGESGSGKDWLAKYIHDHSLRSSGPYLSVNCAAIAPNLAESELFGHEKGSFTGAMDRKRGLLELAEGGSLLLNEIGELALPLQAKLLTFLDTRRFTRVGGEKEISVNVRLLAATNRDLAQEVGEGRFRNDLYYRINVLAISVPPLRDRQEDIPMLVDDLLARCCSDLQIHQIPTIDPALVNALKGYHWPGNVRELRNVLERALILSEGDRLDLEGLELKPRDQVLSADGSIALSFESPANLPEAIDRLTNKFLVEALRRCNGNKRTAARTLGIARDSLYRFLRKFGIEDVP